VLWCCWVTIPKQKPICCSMATSFSRVQLSAVLLCDKLWQATNLSLAFCVSRGSSCTMVLAVLCCLAAYACCPHTCLHMQVRDIDLSRTHGDLPTSPSALAAAAAANSSLLTSGLPCAGVSAPEDAECVVCLDVLEVPVVTPCGHWFCKVRISCSWTITTLKGTQECWNCV
jgi:hypothetical protein